MSKNTDSNPGHSVLYTKRDPASVRESMKVDSKNTSVMNKNRPQIKNPTEALPSPKSNAPSTNRSQLLEKINSPKHILLQITSRSTGSQYSPSNLILSRSLAKNDKSTSRATDGSEFDDIQRLEIIEQNLKQIKNGNMLNQTKKSQNPKTSQNSARVTRTLTFGTNQELLKPANHKPNSSQATANTHGTDLSILNQLQSKPQESNSSPVQIRAKSPSDTRISQESLMQSLRLRQSKFIEVNEDSLIIRDRDENQYGQAEGYEIEDRAWEEMPIYERQAIWLSARNNKIEQMQNNKVKMELRECTFQPQLVTKASNLSKIYSPRNKTPGETPMKPWATQTSASKTERGFMGDMTSARSRSRSLSKEKKAARSSYAQQFEIKKSWNSSRYETFRSTGRIYTPTNELGSNPLELQPPEEYSPTFNSVRSNDKIKVSEMLMSIQSK